jgi:hypothetical protein
MTEQDEKKWRELCNQAMRENDPNKLLNIFLEMDLTMEKEQLLERSVGRKASASSFLT